MKLARYFAQIWHRGLSLAEIGLPTETTLYQRLMIARGCDSHHSIFPGWILFRLPAFDVCRKHAVFENRNEQNS